LVVFVKGFHATVSRLWHQKLHAWLRVRRSEPATPRATMAIYAEVAVTTI
jgi:hypothetical protein